MTTEDKNKLIKEYMKSPDGQRAMCNAYNRKAVENLELEFENISLYTEPDTKEHSFTIASHVTDSLFNFKTSPFECIDNMMKEGLRVVTQKLKEYNLDKISVSLEIEPKSEPKQLKIGFLITLYVYEQTKDNVLSLSQESIKDCLSHSKGQMFLCHNYKQEGMQKLKDEFKDISWCIKSNEKTESFRICSNPVVSLNDSTDGEYKRVHHMLEAALSKVVLSLKEREEVIDFDKTSFCLEIVPSSGSMKLTPGFLITLYVYEL